MRTPRADIHELIHSLSPSEKRFFKLFNSGGSKISDRTVKLFDAINLQQIYDEKKLIEVIGAGARLDVEKVRLYNKVLDAAVVFSSGESIESALHQAIRKINFLYGKGLYRPGLKLLIKTRRLAEDYELFPVLLHLLEWERRFFILGYHKRSIDEIMKQEEETVSVLENIIRYEHPALRTNLMDLKNGVVRASNEVKDYIRAINVSELDQVNVLSFRAKFALFQLYKTYYRGINNAEKELECSKKLLTILEEHPHQIRLRPKLYIDRIVGIQFALSTLGRKDEFIEHMEKLIRFVERYETFLDEHNRARSLMLIDSFKLQLFDEAGELTIDEGYQVINEIEKKLEYYRKYISQGQLLALYGLAAIFHFEVADYRKSLAWSLKIVPPNHHYYREDLQAFAKILAILIHYELGNYPIMDYVINSNKNFLRQKGRFYNTEKALLKFLTELAGNDHSAKELKNKFISFKGKLEEIWQSPLEKNILLYIDLRSWVDSKILGTTYFDQKRKRT